MVVNQNHPQPHSVVGDLVFGGEGGGGGGGVKYKFLGKSTNDLK